MVLEGIERIVVAAAMAELHRHFAVRLFRKFLKERKFFENRDGSFIDRTSCWDAQCLEHSTAFFRVQWQNAASWTDFVFFMIFTS